MAKNLKQVSKGNYDLSHDGNPKLEEVNTSCLMRIADATELMAQNYNKLLAEREQYKNWHKQECAANAILIKRVSALKGIITRMKNKEKGAKNNDETI